MVQHRRARQAPTAQQYAERAARLREYGWKLKGYRKGRSVPAATRSAITRLWEAHKTHLAVGREKQPLKFQRMDKAQRRLATKVISREALTPKGAFLQVPRGVAKKDYRFEVRPGRKGVRATVIETIKGRMRDVVVRPEKRELVLDARGHIIELIRRERDTLPRKRGKGGKLRPRKLKGVKFTVGGMESTGAVMSPSEAGEYTEDLFERFVGDEDDYDSRREYNQRLNEFTDKFQIRLYFED